MRRGGNVFFAAVAVLTTSLSLASSRIPDPETTYTIRATLRLLNPVNPDALNDPCQTAKILKRTDAYTDIEFTLFPLLKSDPIVGNPNWQKDNAGLAEFTKPGVTCNWDEPMHRRLIEQLKADGIDIAALDDKDVVERVSAWLLKRSQYNDKMFDMWFVDFPNGSPRVLPELKKAFESNKGDPAWSEQEQFEHEMLGRGMFQSRTSGSCTSYAILQATVLKALGIPTRIVLLTPIIDSNDPAQIDMVRKSIHHHAVRATVLRGLPPTNDTFSNHTINEVWLGGVGGRWVRLNYRKLDQPILDRNCMGLTVHTQTVTDWSEANYAATWGKRYALGLRDEVSKTANPYRAMELSDHFGTLAKIDNPVVPDPEPKSATVTRAYWLRGPDRPQSVPPASDRSSEFLMLHLESAAFDGDWHLLKTFLMRAPRPFVLKATGHPDVPAQVTPGSCTNSAEDVFDIYLKVAPDDAAQMADGVEYQLSPPADSGGLHWSLKSPLALSKPPH